MNLGKKLLALLRVRRTSTRAGLPSDRPRLGKSPPKADFYASVQTLARNRDDQHTLTKDIENSLAGFLEQLALESFYNGDQFEFSTEEIKARLSGFALQTTGNNESDFPETWIMEQKDLINRLADRWRNTGGPDIEPKVTGYEADH